MAVNVSAEILQPNIGGSLPFLLADAGRRARHHLPQATARLGEHHYLARVVPHFACQFLFRVGGRIEQHLYSAPFSGCFWTCPIQGTRTDETLSNEIRPESRSETPHALS